MAVKKETAQQAAEAATQDDKASQGVQAEKPATEVIHLFKDNVKRTPGTAGTCCAGCFC